MAEREPFKPKWDPVFPVLQTRHRLLFSPNRSQGPLTSPTRFLGLSLAHFCCRHPDLMLFLLEHTRHSVASGFCSACLLCLQVPQPRHQLGPHPHLLQSVSLPLCEADPYPVGTTASCALPALQISRSPNSAFLCFFFFPIALITIYHTL